MDPANKMRFENFLLTCYFGMFWKRPVLFEEHYCFGHVNNIGPSQSAIVITL